VVPRAIQHLARGIQRLSMQDPGIEFKVSLPASIVAG
jgi:hypothetical protein